MDTKKLRQKILNLAIRGKLVSQDPNDEPASVLLERIRAEKERLIKEGKIKRSKKSASDTPHYENEAPFEVPESWEWCIVDDFAYVASGSTPSKDSFAEEGVPYIKMYNLRNQKIDFDFHPQYIKKEVHEGKLQRSKTEVGDLIMNIVGPPLGKLAIIPPSLPESNFNQAAVLIRPYHHKDILVKYLFYYLSEMSEINSISTKGTAGQVNISLTQSQNMRIALPPLEEQKRIISKIDELFGFIELLDDNATSLEEAINKAKSKIIDHAIHGKIVPQDPNDEPAIELLRRIDPSFVPCDNAHYRNLPLGWQFIELGKVCQLAEGEPKERTEMPYLDVKAMRTGQIVHKSSGKYVEAGTMLILVDGENSGEIFKTEVAGYQGSTMKVLDIDRNMNEEYVLQFIKLFKKALKENKVGSAIPHLNKKMFRELVIPIPPRNEQTRIVSAILQYDNIFDSISANL